MHLELLLLAVTAALVTCQEDSSRPVVIRLPPQPNRPRFLDQMSPPRAVQPPPVAEVAQPQAGRQQPPPPPPPPQPAPLPAVPQSLPPQTASQFVPPAPASAAGASSPFGSAAPPAPLALQPTFQQTGSPGAQQFIPHAPEIATPPPPPPVTLPPDVQNQLIKFFGLDSFGIPGLTGNHPGGFAGAVQELHSGGGGGGAALPEQTPGESGLIGLLSTSIRKLVKDTGVADALSQSIPSVLGTTANQQDAPASTITKSANRPVSKSFIAESHDDDSSAASSSSSSSSLNSITSGGGEVRRSEIRRQPSAAQRALSGLAAALGGGTAGGPAHAGLPRIPGIPLLPGGIPRNSQGQIDVVQLIGAITRRVSNGTTLADVLPPEQLQTLADNVTDALLPTTPEHFEMSKFMGRWFEGINSPRATEQRCVVHHYGGLTKTDKTATFTALKIYREGSEFGPVRYSIGYAFRSGNKDAMLQLHSSETSDAQPFWVYKLGPEGKDPFGNPQYEYAIVSNWVKYPVTVLVRDPDTFKAKYEVEVLRWLEDQGFINGFIRAFNLLQPASYGSCQYADSTFEVFGK